MLKEIYSLQSSILKREVYAGQFHGITQRQIDTDKYKQQLDNPSIIWWSEFLRSEKLQSMSEATLNVVDLFCGSGGLTLGVREATQSLGLDIKTLVAADMDTDALRIYKKNFNTVDLLAENIDSLVDFHVYGRKEKAELAYIPEILESKLLRLAGKVDLLVAGPPCQGHSNLNNYTRYHDPRNHLYIATTAIGIALQAKSLVIENVSSVTRDTTGVITTAKTILESCNYHVSDGILEASSLGGGQTRRRHFLIATHREHVPLNEATKILKKPSMTLRELIGDLELIQSDLFVDKVPNLSVENQNRINYLFDNNLYNLPNQIRPNSHKNGHTYPSVYGRLSWDKPSPTITTGFLTPGRGRYIHPSQKRVMTPHEAARVQGFPDWYSFLSEDITPTRSSLSKWIGDAVPTPLGYTAVLTALSGI